MTHTALLNEINNRFNKILDAPTPVLIERRFLAFLLWAVRDAHRGEVVWERLTSFAFGAAAICADDISEAFSIDEPMPLGGDRALNILMGCLVNYAGVQAFRDALQTPDECPDEGDQSPLASAAVLTISVLLRSGGRLKLK